MKKLIKQLSNNELKDYPIIDLVEGWFFRIEEISYGAYMVEGVDRWGRSVSRQGTENELEELLAICAKEAKEINKEIIDNKSKEQQ
jgi:hypothetical protein